MKRILHALLLISVLAVPAPAVAGARTHHLPQGQSTQAQSSSQVIISPEEERRGEERSREGRRLLILGVIYEIVLLSVILFSGLSARLRNAASKLSVRPWLLVGSYFLLLTVVTSVLDFPYDVYSSYRFDHKYGLSNQTFAQWMGDHAKEMIVGIIVGIIVIELLYLVLRRRTRTWWMWATVGSIPLLFILLFVGPLWIAPLFNKFEPLRDQKLRPEILAMAHSQGISANEVFQVDASKQGKALNAYCTGIAKTERIVLYDTLLEKMDADEIKFVMGHEMGHYVLKHTWKLILMGAGIVLAGTLFIHFTFASISRRFQARIGFDDIRDVAGLPLLNLLFTICIVVAFPVINSISRTYEHQADVFGLRLTHDNEAAVRAFQKLAKVNITETDPGPVIETIFYDHPALKNRIEFAKNFKE